MKSELIRKIIGQADYRFADGKVFRRSVSGDWNLVRADNAGVIYLVEDGKRPEMVQLSEVVRVMEMSAEDVVEEFLKNVPDMSGGVLSEAITKGNKVIIGKSRQKGVSQLQKEIVKNINKEPNGGDVSRETDRRVKISKEQRADVLRRKLAGDSSYRISIDTGIPHTSILRIIHGPKNKK